jgi:mRNA interferase MazF
MTKTDPGRVVLVRFPFTNLSSSKRRPALVISDAQYFQLYGDVVLLALTGQKQPAEEANRLKSWEEAGLRKPTWIKPVIMTVSAEIITKALGQINPDDIQRVGQALKKVIAGQFWE